MGWLLVLSMSLALATGLSERVEQLGQASPALREAAAAALRESPPPDDQAEVWSTRVAQVRDGMTRAQVETLLPVFETGPSLGMGRGSRESWRLDIYWTVSAVFSQGGLLQGAPVLDHWARSFWVDPPAGYTGTWVTWYANGQKNFEIEYRGGKYHGAFSSFHDSGQRLVQQHYVEGKAEGTDRGWYHGGQRSYEGQYVDGARHGIWTHWYEDGDLQSREELLGGERHGSWSMWFPSGQLQYEVQYQRGLKHGTDRAWDASGTLLWSRVFEDGVLQD